MSATFKPSRIFVEASVLEEPLTGKILRQFPGVPTATVADVKEIKKSFEMTWAKKGLLLARFKATRPLRNFEANTKSCGTPYYSLGLISNCHLECTYCILQSYLSNNPLITIYTNIGEVVKKLETQLEDLPAGSVIGTGHIADSLALEPIAEIHQTLIPLFGRQKKILLELKTKTDTIETILNLPHEGQTIVSWSLNPSSIMEREEFKTAPLRERLTAAAKCAEAGYKIGFHLDPMIWHEGWEKNYAVLMEQCLDAVPPEKIFWMSLGTLRFPARQALIVKKRFPKNLGIHEGLLQTHLPYLSYPEHRRQKLMESVSAAIIARRPQIRLYYSMESASS